MNDERDNVRVDLLKFRRKVYMEYPEGSPERKKFLKAVLQNELKLTESEVPFDLLDMAIEGSSVVFWNTVRKFLLYFSASVACYFLFIFYYRLSHFSAAFLIMGAFFLGLGIEVLFDYVFYYNKIKLVKQYANDTKRHMNRISNDIKRLEGPR